jgi:hypothetical protein
MLVLVMSENLGSVRDDGSAHWDHTFNFSFSSSGQSSEQDTDNDTDDINNDTENHIEKDTDDNEGDSIDDAIIHKTMVMQKNAQTTAEELTRAMHSVLSAWIFATFSSCNHIFHSTVSWHTKTKKKRLFPETHLLSGRY